MREDRHNKAISVDIDNDDLIEQFSRNDYFIVNADDGNMCNANSDKIISIDVDSENQIEDSSHNGSYASCCHHADHKMKRSSLSNNFRQ